MKKLFTFYISMLLLVASTKAQFITSLNVNNPSAILSEWATFNPTIIYTVETTGASSRQAVIKAELLTLDGSIVARKEMTKAPVYTLQGTRIFYARDVFPLNEMIFSPGYQKSIEQTGALPAGTYRLSVQLVEPGIFGGLSPVQSRVINLATPQLPYLITPVNNDSLQAKKAETAIIFRWTALAPQPQTPPFYRIQVFQVYPYQHPLQALRGNQPVLDQFVRGTTQYIWRPQIDFSNDSLATKFIWTIQTLNSNRQPVITTLGNGESRSEPFMFFIKGVR